MSELNTRAAQMRNLVGQMKTDGVKNTIAIFEEIEALLDNRDKLEAVAQAAKACVDEGHGKTRRDALRRALEDAGL